MSTMQASTKTQIVENLNYLPEISLQKVFDFVEFLRYRSFPSDDPILDVAGIFPGESLKSLEIDHILYGVLEGE